MLRLNLFDYSDAYIVAKGSINVRVTVNTDIDREDVAFKNNARFRLTVTVH